MQMGQIAGIHAHWTSGVTAQSPEETGARIGAVDVSSHQENLHLTCESPLFKMEKKIVPKEAIALQYHDPATEKATMILPPTMGAPAVAIAQTKWQPIRDLVGTGASSTPSVDSMRVTPLQIFGRQRVPTDLCKVVADAGLLTVETFAMLGDTIAAVKQTVKTMLADDSKLGADPPRQELALTSLAAVWRTCSTMQEHFAARRAKMEEDPNKVPEIPGEDHAEFRQQFIARHPDVVLPHHREPHRKFVERLQRDFLVHGAVNFYEVGEMRTRNETIAQKSGISRSAEDLLKVVQVDQPVHMVSESQVMDKLHAFFVALEYLNICEFSYKAGPLQYLSDLEEWRHENRGLALLLAVDSLIRKKVYRLNSDHKQKYTTFSAALLEVLQHHKQLWNDARSGAELDKFKQAHQSSEPTTPVRNRKRSRSRSVPWDPLVVRSYGPWFLEVFSGTARLSTYVASLGIPVLPPVDIELSEMVPQAVDVLDLEIWDRIMQLAHVGAIFFVHLGTPCNSFSSARKLDGGPPPLRSPQCPMGLPDLSEANQGILFLGNMFACRSVELAMAVFSTGGDFSIENPLLSLLWATPLLVELARLARCFDVDFDQCVYGAPSVKPTRLRVTAQIFEVLSVSCPGNHAHVQLRGQIWDAKKERFVFRTKLAQEYPYALCASMALLVHQLWLGELPQFDASFNLAPVDRKRPLGQLARWKGHRQEDSARQALVSGYQLKRGALKPLLDIEMEPGQAARWALTVVHPFTVQLDVEASLQTAVHALALQPAAVIARRLEALQWWEAEAHRLLPETIARIEAQSDPDLRTLLRGCSESQTPKLGQVCHVALYEAMLLKVASVDVQLADDLLHGFPIVGAIRASGRWPPYAKPQVVLPVSDALARAWEIRKKIVQRVKAVQVSENLQKIWDATLEDCSEGYDRFPASDEKSKISTKPQTEMEYEPLGSVPPML
eukprot:g8162.t1